MTLVNIVLKNVAGEYGPDDCVVFHAPQHREGIGGQTINTAPKTVALVGGVGSVELDPGPVTVTLRTKGWEDTAPKTVNVPEAGPVTLTGLLLDAFEWSPVVVSQVRTLVDMAESAADRAETVADTFGSLEGVAVSVQAAEDAAVRAEAGADRVGTAEQVGTWAQQAQDAADRVGSAEQVEGWADDARNSASGASTSESKAKEYKDAAADYATGASMSAALAKTSETNAATHEANSLSAAERAEFAAEETIQQVSGDFATRNYADASLETYLGSTSRILPVDTDLNTLITPQVRSLPSAGRRYANTPYPDPVGTLLVYDSHNSTKNMQVQVLIGTNPAQMWVRDRNSGGNWASWRNFGFHDVAHIDPGAGRRDAIVDYGLSKRGRLIGTGGKAAVALRFDHHLDQFGDKVLPLLKKYRLPWGQMINAGNIGKGNDTWAWSKLAQECHISGGEVWNHSWSHSNVTFTGAADREVTLGLDDLRAGVPTLWVDGWAAPGQPELLGMEGSEKPERFYDTYPGRLVLAQHAFVRGYYPGVYQPLAGPNLIGAPHVTMDAQAATWCEAVIRGAINNQAGLTLMLHPNYLDTAGRMTTADLDRVLGFIAARRDAGELMVLSTTGILMADSARPDTANILTGVLGSPGSATGALVETASVREAPLHYGVPHEAVAWVKGAGSAELKVEVTSPTYPVTATHAVTLGAAAQRLSVPVTPPLDTTATKITLTLNGTHTGVKYRPI